MPDKTYIAGVADLHTNSTVGLSVPVINLDDGGTYHASRAQRWLWECWLDYWQKVKALKNAGGRIVTIVNGDLGEKDSKLRTNQIITINKADIQKHVRMVLEPALDASDIAIIDRGTAAHVGAGAWLEEAIAKDITIIKPQSKEIFSHWHFRGSIAGCKIDAAHHASMGGLPWTRANAANKLAARAIWHYRAELDQEPPDFILRSHNHTYADSGCNFPTTAIFTPAWTLITEYGYRLGYELTLASIGGIIIDATEKRFWAERYYAKETRKVWALQI